MDLTQDILNQRSRIRAFFPDDLLKELHYRALSLSILDNNEKADIIKDILLSVGNFSEIGTGTNRTTFLRDGYIFKIALDRRGYIDNFTEFKRSKEVPQYFTKTYETNLLISVAEYVNVMTKEEFLDNRDQIKILLEDLSREYIFGDLGIGDYKNYTNYGYRRSTGSIVALDYAYCHPILDVGDALKCPNCGNTLQYTSDFSSFKCPNVRCALKLSYMDVRRRMRSDFENIENQVIANITSMKMPNFNAMWETINESRQQTRRVPLIKREIRTDE